MEGTHDSVHDNDGLCLTSAAEYIRVSTYLTILLS